MKKSDRGKNVPYVRPVRRVELSDMDVKIRMILIVVFLSIAVVAMVAGFRSVLRVEPGWQEITVKAERPNCGDDFALNYDFSAAGSSATSQFKTLTALYSAACEDAFRIFSPDVEGSGTANVHDLNRHPNETVTLEPVLYDALSLFVESGNRHIYLGNVYAEYERIFYSENEVEAASFDPAQNPEQAEYIAELAAFANDPAMIDLQLLGDNQVKLLVSDAYLAFAQMYELENLVDFGWMRNAFIADYLAQTLMDHGFTNGYLASFDGFTRNLDTRGNSYSFNVFDRRADGIYMPAVLTYTAPASIVFLRDYPMGRSDAWHYYTFGNGRIVSLLIDPADGINKVSVDSLVSYSQAHSCAELLLNMMPVFVGDTFDAAPLQNLAEGGIHSIWCEDTTVCYTDEHIDLALVPQENAPYTKVFAG